MWLRQVNGVIWLQAEIAHTLNVHLQYYSIKHYRQTIKNYSVHKAYYMTCYSNDYWCAGF